MKKILLFLILGMSVIHLHAQSQIIWQTNAGGTSYDMANDMAQDASGNCVLVGTTLSTDLDAISHHGLYYEDFFVVKIDKEGTLLWAKCFGGTSQDIAQSVSMVDSSIYVSGYTWSGDGDISNPVGADDFWLIELSSDGELLWQKSYGGSYSDESYSMALNGDNLLLGGTTISEDNDVVKNPNSYYDALLINTNQQGDLKWSKTYGGALSERFNGLLALGSQIFAVGMSNTEDTSFVDGYGASDFYVANIDYNGEALWQKRYGGSNEDEANDIAQINDTSFIVVGKTLSSDYMVHNAKGNFDVWLLAINNSGDTLWTKTLGGTKEDIANKVIVTRNNSILVAGSTESDDGDVHGHHPGNKDFWVIALDFSGDTLWTKCIGSTVEDAAYGIVEDENFVITGSDDISYKVAGYTQSANGDVLENYALSDFWVAAITQNLLSLKTNNLAQVNIFPNPSDEGLSFQTDFMGRYKAEIIDLKGQVLISKEFLNADGYLELYSLQKGVYLIRFEQNNTRVVKSFILK